MLKIKYLSVRPETPPSGYWDQTFLSDLLTSLNMYESDRQIVIIPGAYQDSEGYIQKINEFLFQYKKVLVFVTSDEEGRFDCSKLKHPDMIHYRQYGYCEHNKLFPIGYTAETRRHLKRLGLVDKNIQVFFAGQLNSDERRFLFSRLAMVKKAVLFGTDGFSKGLKPKDYYEYLAHAVCAPSPGGHVSPDSFRFYEGLEAMCFPTDFPLYMKNVFFENPFLEDNLSMFAWWIRQKMLWRQRIKEDLGISDAMTTLIPTSPIKSHPSTGIIDQTIKSVRHHTQNDIFIMIDGVRPEQEDMRANYMEYIRRLLWKCNFEYENVMPILFKNHVHQSGMMRRALQYVKTPFVMYVEHDTPLVTDQEIEWEYIGKVLGRADANVVRFHYEAVIPEPHKHLMLPEKDIPYMLATRQWSQRPHVARTGFYREIMKFFSEGANCFIEDLIYGKCVEADWNVWRLYIYNHPTGMKRSLNLDGRAGDKKFEKEQIW